MSSSSVAGTPASTRPGSWRVAASPSRSSRPARSAGAHRRATAASSTPATNGARGQLIKRYGQDTGRALYQETLDSYQLVKQLIAEEAIDCDFREVGHLELAYAPAHAPELEHARESLASVGVRSTVVPREHIHEEIGSDAYFGALAVEGSGLLHPGRYFGGLAAAADRAGADLHEGVRAKRIRQGGRRLRRRDRARRHPGTRRLRRDERLYRWRRPVAPPADHPDRLVHHRVRALPEELAHELSPKGRAFFDTKNFLYYWHVSADRRMVFGGRASFMPTTIDRTAAILWRGLLEVHPQMAGHRIEYAWGGNVGFTFDRMPHVGRTKDGVTYAMGCCGTGVALMTNLGNARSVPGWRAARRRPSRVCDSRWCRRRTRADHGSCRSPGSGSACRTDWPRAPVTGDS